jgi:hypothetical protein
MGFVEKKDGSPERVRGSSLANKKKVHFELTQKSVTNLNSTQALSVIKVLHTKKPGTRSSVKPETVEKMPADKPNKKKNKSAAVVEENKN